MVRGPAAPLGAFEHQRDLLAHPLLADELVQPLGPQRCLDHPLPVAGIGLDQLPVGQRGELVGRQLLL